MFKNQFKIVFVSFFLLVVIGLFLYITNGTVSAVEPQNSQISVH